MHWKCDVELMIYFWCTKIYTYFFLISVHIYDQFLNILNINRFGYGTLVVNLCTPYNCIILWV